MPILRSKIKHREDIISMSMSEIILFFLFFCLILLGSLFDVYGLDEGKASAKNDAGGMKLEDLLENLRHRHDEIAGLHIKIGELEQAKADAEQDLYDVQIQLGDLRTDLDLKNATIVALQAENAALKTENGEFKDEIERLVIRIGVLQDLVDELKERLAVMTIAKEDAEGALSDLQGKYDQQILIVVSKDTEIAELKDQIVILRGQNALLSEEVAGLKGDNDNLTFSFKDALVEAEKNALIILGLRQAVEEAEETAEDAEQRMHAAERYANEMREKWIIVLGQRDDAIAKRDDAIVELAQRPEHDLDALVTLDADAGYTFDTSEAEVSTDFDTAFIKGLDGRVSGISQVQALLQSAEGKNIEAIEVIGHTDEQRYRAGDFDKRLMAYVNRRASFPPDASNNLELGMVRAAAAARYLREQLRIPGNGIPAQFRNLPVIPMTAGELLLRNGNLTTGVVGAARNDDKRRRVEIRLRSKPSNN